MEAGIEVYMHNHHFVEMLKVLRPVLKNQQRAEQILTRYWRNKMAIVWETRDVHRAANEREVVLTNKEAITILKNLHEHHNPQLGLKWEDITTHIKEHVLGRKLTKREVNQFVHHDKLTIQR